MMIRAASIAFALLAVSAIVSVARAAEPKPEKGTMHEGIVVSAGEGKLVMSDADGKNEHTHKVGDNVPVTMDGRPAKLAALPKGSRVVVTTDNEKEVIAVACTSKVRRT